MTWQQSNLLSLYGRYKYEAIDLGELLKVSVKEQKHEIYFLVPANSQPYIFKYEIRNLFTLQIYNEIYLWCDI